jgi:hypothetical protein
MPTIDADAHVIECEQTWSYIKDEKIRPYMINPGAGRPQNWLVDGRVFNRGVNLDRNLPLDICEMQDISGRLRHSDIWTSSISTSRCFIHRYFCAR